MEIQGERSIRRCVVLPIDNKVGIVCDGYTAKDPETGLAVEKSFDNVLSKLYMHISVKLMECRMNTNDKQE